ncbi:hypothetical protein [Streptomyces hydrogenans]|uniref:hypothetical protein n=1 Tax=Streptomyces hydrogenans TaxID=1873719 RepID=UPI003D763707
MTEEHQDPENPEAGAPESPDSEPSPAPKGRGRGSGAAASDIVARLSGLGKKTAAKKTAPPAKKTAAPAKKTAPAKTSAKKAAPATKKPAAAPTKKAAPAKKAPATKKTAASPSTPDYPYRKKGDWVYEEGVPIMPAEQEAPRALYSARITFTTTEQQRRALEEAKLDDRIDKTARLRAMVALWEQDERLRKRVDRLARTMQ